MSKTNTGLVAYAKAQLGNPYWWGTFGQTASASLFAQKRAQYPREYAGYGAEVASQYVKKVHDCVGLIKGYRWCDTPSSAPKYNGAQDVAVYGLYDQCDLRGNISTMPDVPGVCVFMSGFGHVGVYIGNGKVIEATGHARGVVETDFQGRGWAYWGMPSWITYEQVTTTPATPAEQPSSTVKTYDTKLPMLSLGCKSQAVISLQRLLVGRYYNIGRAGIDGDFGNDTRQAVLDFQKSYHLETDGIVGPETWAKLIGG